MKHINTLKLSFSCILWAISTATMAQHQHGSGASPASAGLSPYAGQQVREIKSLSASQTQDLLTGKGMELAKAAELNGYPGPMHTLELAQPLELNEQQKQDSEALLARHKAEARALGAQLVQAERELDTAFAARRIDAETLAGHTQRIGQLQAALRASHLKTHLQQTQLLTSEQVARYALLRGYTAPTAPFSATSHQH
ncbi:Spy/CpxP family protein refolding chaperone [Polaromonas aquatica]|uniref:Spy/CpxP family protein refolding chaperone n=1 Tax=Polaromonas aquatica TaxID=332657 RepID=UPI003D6608C1